MILEVSKVMADWMAVMLSVKLFGEILKQRRTTNKEAGSCLPDRERHGRVVAALRPRSTKTSSVRAYVFVERSIMQREGYQEMSVEYYMLLLEGF